MTAPTLRKKSLGSKMWDNRQYYLMLLPALIYVIIFCYVPMYGLQIAFKNFMGSKGIVDSDWVGLRHFLDFFDGFNFWSLIENTLAISVYSLVVNFPIPILVALILNELRPGFKRFSQTVLYAPHFISTVVLVGMISTLFSQQSGVVNTLLEALGMERYYFMGEPAAFRHLYVWSGTWQQMGWSAIIYLAALSAVDPGLHEAAELDGASRLQRIININLPCILPTVIIMLIMSVGNIASVGYEKVWLMRNELNVDVAEVISTYVYQRGILDSNYSFTSAVGLFNNVVNIIMLFLANGISRKVSETSLF